MCYSKNRERKDTLNLIPWSLAFVASLFAFQTLYWVWLQLGLPNLDVRLPVWSETQPITEVPARMNWIFCLVYGILAVAFSFWPGSEKAVFTLLARVRNPFGAIRYRGFLIRAAKAKKLSKSETSLFEFQREKTRLIWGLPLGVPFLAECYALFGLLYLVVAPLGLAEFTGLWFKAGPSWWNVIFFVLGIYYALYYIAILFSLFLFHIVMRGWHRNLHRIRLGLFLLLISVMGFLLNLLLARV